MTKHFVDGTDLPDWIIQDSYKHEGYRANYGIDDKFLLKMLTGDTVAIFRVIPKNISREDLVSHQRKHYTELLFAALREVPRDRRKIMFLRNELSNLTKKSA
ncbi:hypothetical protein LL912_00655 [Niabella sp. CC-SYL272]|uniref:hypothetical protein n=1 Tax=Niabella agricola TaxID=2891571 RepID=UPI001F411D0E|nr:hypothetical protein [Niabella agricola]MCF3107277.1 hypothetical protein [Niabella agricola]